MTAPSANVTVRVCQCQASPRPEDNRERLLTLLGQRSDSADLTVLPENALCWGHADSIRHAARTASAWATFLAPLANAAGGILVAGGVPVIPTSTAGESRKLFQSALVIDSSGQLLGRYDKRRLFQLDPEKAAGSDETLLYQPGAAPTFFTCQGWRIGIAICFDLRFPELFRESRQPADLWLVPAAFAAETGQAHWQPLLRARAIENQCHIAAADLCGSNQETGFACHGHSLLVGPWGEVMAEAPGDTPGCLVVTLSRQHMEAVRRRLPMSPFA